MQIPIILISEWNIDIRPCELTNFCLIFSSTRISFTRTVKYEDFMQFLTEEELNLLDIVNLKNKEYNKIKNNFSEDKLKHLFNCLDMAREIILKNKPG
ncbi:hypothetical protein ACHIVK_09120, partial [Campylobacter jejuni]